MGILPRSWLRFWLISLGAVLTAAPLVLAQHQLPRRLPDVLRGEAAIQALGPDLPSVAVAHGLQSQALANLFRVQSGLRVDQDGSLLFVCEGAPVLPSPSASADASSSSQSPVVSADGDPFRLHSFPGATRVIYLDFNGHTTSGTRWNTNFSGGADIVSGPIDLDGSPSTFGAAEQNLVRRVWQRVAEDYAPFAVDVTTEDPGVEALRRTSQSDESYGVRVVITPSNWHSQSTGGIAYIASFSWNSDTPCFSFAQSLQYGEKAIAECVSHEAGHTLGLYHDGATGSSGTEYYMGHGNWAPIMGVAYYRPVSEFSRGEYANANNTQDDLAVISTFVPYASDDHGNSTGNASSLSGPTISDGGTIESSSDVDVFRFVAATGAVTLNIQGPSPEPNLDIKAELLDANGNVMQTSNPSTLNAAISASVSGGTYYLRVSGVGAGDPATSGYSSYGSIGNYIITGSLTTAYVNQSPTAVATVQSLSGTAPFTANFSGSNSSDPDGSIVSYSWNFGNGDTSSAANPTYTYYTPGSYQVILTVRDNTGNTGTATLQIQVGASQGAAPVFTAHPSSQEVPAGSSVTFSSAATGSPTPTYQWRMNGVPIPGANNATYTRHSVSQLDSNSSFSVVATNDAGSATSNSAMLWVSGQVASGSAPVFTVHPTSLEVPAGSSVTFTSAATGTPAPSYQWRVNGNDVPGATNATYTRSSVSQADSNSSISVLATNAFGTASSNTAMLWISVGPPVGNASPVFTLHPSSQEAPAGSSVTFTAAATGTPTPAYQWQMNGVPIPGATNATYTRNSISQLDSNSSFSVVASNTAGSASSNVAMLWVSASPFGNSAPVFTLHPWSQEVSAGNSVTFAVAATGTPSPTYQWRVNGVAVPGATGATYTRNSVSQLDSNSSVSVDAINSAGTVSSNTAMLWVRP